MIYFSECLGIFQELLPDALLWYAEVVEHPRLVTLWLCIDIGTFFIAFFNINAVQQDTDCSSDRCSCGDRHIVTTSLNSFLLILIYLSLAESLVRPTLAALRLAGMVLSGALVLFSIILESLMLWVCAVPRSEGTFDTGREILQMSARQHLRL